MTELELKLLLDHCETAGLHENGGFGYSVKDPRWNIPENCYHFLIIYPCDRSITVETWREHGDEAEASREIQDPTLKDVFEEMQKQGRGLSFVISKGLKVWTEEGTWGCAKDAKMYSSDKGAELSIKSLVFHHGEDEFDLKIQRLKDIE